MLFFFLIICYTINFYFIRECNKRNLFSTKISLEDSVIIFVLSPITIICIGSVYLSSKYNLKLSKLFGITND